MNYFPCNHWDIILKNVDIKFRHLSGMTFIKYAQNQIIGKPNHVKVHEQPIGPLQSLRYYTV
jgi:hypothetical protein